MTHHQFLLLARSLGAVLRNQSAIFGVLASDHADMPALRDLAKLAAESADICELAVANDALRIDPAHARRLDDAHHAYLWESVAPDDPPSASPQSLDDYLAAAAHEHAGTIFATHSCWRCQDGKHPERCLASSPRQCENLHARND